MVTTAIIRSSERGSERNIPWSWRTKNEWTDWKQERERARARGGGGRDVREETTQRRWNRNPVVPSVHMNALVEWLLPHLLNCHNSPCRVCTGGYESTLFKRYVMCTGWRPKAAAGHHDNTCVQWLWYLCLKSTVNVFLFPRFSTPLRVFTAGFTVR